MIELAPAGPGLQAKKYYGFACPQESLNENLMQTLAVVYSRKSVRHFLAFYSPVLDLYSTGLTALLGKWLEQESNFEAVWDFSLGNILDGLWTRIYDPAIILQRGLELALRLAWFGLEGNWQASLPEAVRLRFSHYHLSLAERLEVVSSKNRLEITLSCGSKNDNYTFNCTSKGWQPGENQPESFRYLKTGASEIKLLPLSAFQPEEQEVFKMAPNKTSEEMLANLQASLDLIAKYSPIYLPWIERVIRAIVPGEAAQNLFFSFSLKTRPGVIHASLNIRPVVLAELLVHEATHQYMHLLTRLGPLDDGSDPTLYFSPVKETGRPIGAITLAYHAFVNIILFYRLCQKNGFADDGYCEYNEKIMVEQVMVLEKALRTSPALTAQGRALWEPLTWRLKEV